MQPTLNPDTNFLSKDIVLVDIWSVFNEQYQRGDVVILTAPHDPDILLTKRIVALEGDMIAIRPKVPVISDKSGIVTKDGKDLQTQSQYIKIPKGRCWVESDEPFHGVDSNTFGPIPVGLLKGKVSHVVWPLKRFGHQVENKIPPLVAKRLVKDVFRVSENDEDEVGAWNAALAVNNPGSIIKAYA